MSPPAAMNPSSDLSLNSLHPQSSEAIESSQTGIMTPSIASSLGSRTTSSLSVNTEEKKPKDYLVTWEGPDDLANPKNWSNGSKWTISLIVSAFAFLSPLSSSIAAPALDSIQRELHIHSASETNMVMSIFMLTYALGPFILSPCSEIWGRTRIIRFGNILFILFTALCGWAQTKEQIIAFRFFAGIGGSATMGMGSGVLADCWRSEERGKGLTVYQLAPVLGPAIGPIAGGYIEQYAKTWRWSFWAIVIFNLAIQVVAFFFLHETYAPRILGLKAQALRASTGDEFYQTEFEMQHKTLPALLKVSLSRPWVMLGTQPIIQALALYQAFNYGMMYLIISSFPDLWRGSYGMSRDTASLNYISLAVGSLIGVNICGPLTDRVYARQKRRHGIAKEDPGSPEFRIPLMIPASLITPIGIAIFAWTAQYKAHFLLPNLGVAIMAGSSMISYQCIGAYIADCYSHYTASASAACCFLRSLGAFAFPLFAPALFDSLGYGWGGSVLVLVAVLVGVPAPLLFWKFGAKLRMTGCRLGLSHTSFIYLFLFFQAGVGNIVVAFLAILANAVRVKLIDVAVFIPVGVVIADSQPRTKSMSSMELTD
ncbi:putative Major facilitator superfamily transporter [Seiridium cardinale]|uniref:Major facilitator superfamily transporter n=1 Tax=Seiridium cardinale TaxID=138064 RepID=A0ABR2Y2E0_9PEZI